MDGIPNSWALEQNSFSNTPRLPLFRKKRSHPKLKPLVDLEADMTDWLLKCFGNVFA